MRNAVSFETTQKLNCQAYYDTDWGAAYLGDSLELMGEIPDDSIDLIFTSPPFALVRKKEYGNVDAALYLEWFKPFAQEFYRILKPQGSLVIEIGGSWLKGYPVRSLYHFELVIALCKPVEAGGLGFYLAQDLYWYNPAKLPTPAEWVTIRRERVKDAVNPIWWFAKNPHPKANNHRVLRPYSSAMKNLLKNGYDPKLRPSGHDISTKFQRDRGGAIPPNLINGQDGSQEIGTPILAEFDGLVSQDLVQPVNVISASNTASNDYYQRRCKETQLKPHPARFPQALPEFIINLCTEPGDIVLDPFAGSNMTGRVAETLERHWLAFEIHEPYLAASRFRFEEKNSKSETLKREQINKLMIQVSEVIQQKSMSASEKSWLQRIQQQRAIAVIRSPKLELGLNMALAVAKGGIELIEITWNSDSPGELIGQLRAELPDCIIGAGTLLKVEDVENAIASGAEFLFTPHTNLSLIQTAVKAGIPIIPGALSPTEILTAWEAGASSVKVFPVQTLGGVHYIRTLKPVIGHIPLIPTGGVTLTNAREFIEAGAIAVGLSSELFPQALIKAEDWAGITQIAQTLKHDLQSH